MREVRLLIAIVRGRVGRLPIPDCERPDPSGWTAYRAARKNLVSLMISENPGHGAGAAEAFEA